MKPVSNAAKPKPKRPFFEQARRNIQAARLRRLWKKRGVLLKRANTSNKEKTEKERYLVEMAKAFNAFSWPIRNGLMPINPRDLSVESMIRPVSKDPVAAGINKLKAKEERARSNAQGISKILHAQAKARKLQKEMN